MLLTKQGGESDDLSYETNELLVTKTVAFAAAAKNTVDQMMMSGTNINNLSYLRPTMAGFDTAPNYNKVFHPEGGGLTLTAPDPSLFMDVTTAATPGNPKSGWYMGRFNNVEWTPTTANDILFVAYNINSTICAAINKKITGSTSIPVLSVEIAPRFVSVADGSATNANFAKAECPACDGYPSLCVVGPGNVRHTYYNIISAQ